jgi:serine phosphatase RsbU (regulator of sigma subunit)
MFKHLFTVLSIKVKLRAAMLITSILLVIIISASLFTHEIFSLKQNLARDLLTLADISGSNSSVGLVFGNVEAAADTLATLKAKANIVEARVFDAEGESFAYYLRDDAKPVRDAPSLNDVFAPHQTDNSDLADQVFFGQDHVDVIKHIIIDGKKIGTVYIQADLAELDQRLRRYILLLLLIMLIALVLSALLSERLQQSITRPLFTLIGTINRVSGENDYALRCPAGQQDELGRLIEGFNSMLGKIQARDHEINTLNQRLAAENQRMGVELEVSRRLQQMLLPRKAELHRACQVLHVDIACYMEAADEVGGDYYDVLYHDGRLKLGIGDVTGHGLESGVIMLMAQTAVRTLLNSGERDPKRFLKHLNQTLYDNVQRMGSDKNLTLALLDYQSDGHFRICGQHEEILVVRASGVIERVDTLNLGFMVGLLEDIDEFVNHQEMQLAPGDGIVLYTDGIHEAQNENGKMYGLSRFSAVISANWHRPTQEIQEAILDDLRQYIGKRPLLDDITLLILKRRTPN